MITLVVERVLLATRELGVGGHLVKGSCGFSMEDSCVGSVLECWTVLELGALAVVISEYFLFRSFYLVMLL